MTESPASPPHTPIAIPSIEGEMEWDVLNAGKPCKTWYRVYGNLHGCSKRPLVVLHGGPGVTSDYLTPFSNLATLYSIPVVIYDQLGNGLSTHLPEKMGDVGFWTEQLFMDELKLLLQHIGVYDDYDLLGHSWGGMLGARHAARQPGGLKHLIIASSPASQTLWIEAQNELRKQLAQDVQDTLTRCEVEGTTDSKEYQDAVSVYYSKFLCLVNPTPEELQNSFGWLDKDPTVYLTMNGPSEFFVTGPMKDWTILDEAHKIMVPTLLTNGWKDEAADSCVYPYFKLIPKVRWIQFAESSHMAHIEETDKYLHAVGDFLNE